MDEKLSYLAIKAHKCLRNGDLTLTLASTFSSSSSFREKYFGEEEPISFGDFQRMT